MHSSLLCNRKQLGKPTLWLGIVGTAAAPDRDRYSGHIGHGQRFISWQKHRLHKCMHPPAQSLCPRRQVQFPVLDFHIKRNHYKQIIGKHFRELHRCVQIFRKCYQIGEESMGRYAIRQTLILGCLKNSL